MSTALVRTQVVEGWTLGFSGDEDEPKIQDAELADKLEYRSVAEFRKLARDHERAGTINPFHVRAAVARSGAAPRTQDQLWFSREDALFLSTQSGQPKGIALTKDMIRVYFKYQDAKARDAHRESGLSASSDLRNNYEFAIQCKSMLRTIATVTGMSWNAAHGILRKRFGVVSYLRIRTAEWPIARDWLIDRITNPVVPLRRLVESTRQLNMDEYFRQRTEH